LATSYSEVGFIMRKSLSKKTNAPNTSSVRKRSFQSAKPSDQNSSRNTTNTPTPKNTEDIRLNKYIAQCGIASRRAADELIKSGKIKVNGQIIVEPGTRITAKDKISYEGKLLKPESKLVYLLMNKPKDVITTTEDDKGRRTVLDLIQHKVSERIYPVGRLDRNTTGLLLLTNDGELAKILSHPSSEVRKIYHAVLDKKMIPEDLQKIAAGLDLEDGKTYVDGVSFIDGLPPNEIGITIHSGKNRIVRRIFEHLGYEVIKLDRVAYAGLTKRDLPRGHTRALTDKEITLLKHFGVRKKKPRG
jgi:23S rRNA pseudouridine2605 synthase